MQIASDISRDGMGAELLNFDGEAIAEVFRSDRDHTLMLSAFNNDVPLEAIFELVEYAMKRLDPFEDGTPLTAMVGGLRQYDRLG